MRKSVREKLAEAKRPKFENTYLQSYEDLLALILDGDRPQKEREINPTQLAFIQDPTRIKAYMGPAGVAKTSTGVGEILMHAVLEPGTKYLIGRADYNDLQDTTMRRAEEMVRFLPAGTLLDRQSAPPAKWWIRPAASKVDGEANDEPSQITFMGLKDQMGSYEFNGAFIDEATEVEESRVHEVNTRLRHKRGHKFLSLAFNPPPITHWLHAACTGKDEHGEPHRVPAWIKLFMPVKGENVRNLPDNYHELLASTLPEDMKQRLVEGVWGTVPEGDAVIPQFKVGLHARNGLEYAHGTLFRFWDFGFRRPACLWAQVTLDGRMQILREYLGHQMTGEAFIAKVLQETATHYPTAHNVVDYGDPAVKQQKDTGSMLALMRQAGIAIRFQQTPFDLSLRVLRKRFEILIKGEPAIVIDRRHCPHLVAGLGGGYHFKKDGVTPHKDEFYDHEVDALRYGVWNLFGISESSTSTSHTQSVAYWAAYGNDQ